MNNKKIDKKDIIIIVLIMILLLFLIGTVIFFINYKKYDKNYTIIPLEKEIEMPITSEEKTESMSESVEIPGYTNFEVSNKKPTVKLSNPESNTVYMVYTILENDNLVYKTKAIKPGNMVELNLKELLDKGNHNLTIQINTYDLDTEEACNGATQNSICVVK